jgi:peptidyl-prolyl cis-trans isomerase B (cyclophilin B)
MKNWIALITPVFILSIMGFAFFNSRQNKNDYTSPAVLEKQEVNSKINSNTKEDVVSDLYVIKTSKGDITVRLDKGVAPITVENFVNKASSNYYKGLTFHRVEDWVIQGGDPLGNGTGGGDIKTELSNKAFKIGSLGVARAGNIEISNDSQFFICVADCAFLTGQYTNFGDVVSGMDVAKAIAVGDKILSVAQVNK